MEKADISGGLSAQDLVFALDIGTRSVTGIVGVLEDRILRVTDVECIEHDERSIIDGQIEDIARVGKIVTAVRERLEARLGIGLRNVCVAAAGRSLKTRKAVCEFSLDPKKVLDAQTVLALEAGAVDEAKRLLSEQASVSADDDLTYRCVGYSVMRYYLDDYPMKSLLNHKGKIARVEVIATFLPVEVVDSLTEAMSMASLRIASLTLEPIAAMNAVIPQELRLLNLALVDVGAGTSDIALSDGGSVVAYAMATVAGDEITEAVSKEYLVDFHTAEKIKFDLSAGLPEISYVDILGFEHTTAASDVFESIRPAVESLAEVIVEKILEHNTKPPAAIFLVGGGSRTPGLADCIAARIGIDRNKIAVGGGNYIKRSVISDYPIDGPEYATPLGIAITAALAHGADGFFVSVNGSKTRLFKRELVTVMDALLASGYGQDQIIGRSGADLTFTLNHRKKTVRGELPKPAQILLNGKAAAISTLINSGDRIEFSPAKSGRDASYTVSRAIKDVGECYAVYGNDKLPLRLKALLNGKQARRKDYISPGDEILVFSDTSVAELCSSLGMDPSGHRFIINGEEKESTTKVRHGDIVDFLPLPPSPARTEAPQDTGDAAPSFEQSSDRSESPQHSDDMMPAAAQPSARTEFSQYSGDVPPATGQPSAKLEIPTFTGPVDTVRKELAAAKHSDDGEKTPEGGTESDTMRIYLNGELFELPRRKNGTPNLFIDLFTYLDIDTSNPQGRIVLRINGHDASYLEELSDGDDVQIYWEKALV